MTAGPTQRRKPAQATTAAQDAEPAAHDAADAVKTPEDEVLAEAARKTAALASYRALLRGAELPDALVAEALAADLVAARESLDQIATMEPASGYAVRLDLVQVRRQWDLAQASPKRLAAEFGAPFLSLAINSRLRDEAEAQEEARRQKGAEVFVLLPADTVGRLVDRRFIAAADRENPEKLACAVREALDFALDPPPLLPDPMAAPKPATPVFRGVH
jgi:hypothetical protein